MRDNKTGKIYCNSCKTEIACMEPQPWGWSVLVKNEYYELVEGEKGLKCTCGAVENIEQYEETYK